MSETRLPLPPRRPLPPDVRERMRRRVMAEDHVPEKRPNHRGPLIAAAAVVLLAAGGAVGAQVTRDDTPPAAPPPVATAPDWTKAQVRDVETTGEDLAKCGVAGLRSARTLVVPGRRVVVGDTDDAGGRRFCEITYTRVSVSVSDRAPIPLADGAVSILWRTPTGLFLGQAPPTADSMTAHAAKEEQSFFDALPRLAKLLPGGLFLLQTHAQVENVEFTDRAANTSTTARLAGAELPASEWATTRDNYPSGTGGDDLMTNQAARCLDAWMTEGPPFDGPVPGSFGDPADWHPTVRAGQDGTRGLLVLRGKEGETAYCLLRDGVVSDLQWARQEAELDGLYRVLGSAHAMDQGITIFAGTVEPVVGELVFTVPGQLPVRAEVSDGTFAVRLTGPHTDVPLMARDVTVDVNTPEGLVLYRGPAG